MEVGGHREVKSNCWSSDLHCTASFKDAKAYVIDRQAQQHHSLLPGSWTLPGDHSSPAKLILGRPASNQLT